MLAHADQWLQFARDQGYDIELSDLLFVTGHTKTAQWTNAVFHGSERGGAVHLQANAASLVQGSFQIGGQHTVVHGVDCGKGPENPKDNPLPEDFNQTVFLSAFKMARKLPLIAPKVIKAAGFGNDRSPPTPPKDDGPASTETIFTSVDDVLGDVELAQDDAGHGDTRSQEYEIDEIPNGDKVWP